MALLCHSDEGCHGIYVITLIGALHLSTIDVTFDMLTNTYISNECIFVLLPPLFISSTIVLCKIRVAKIENAMAIRILHCLHRNLIQA